VVTGGKTPWNLHKYRELSAQTMDTVFHKMAPVYIADSTLMQWIWSMEDNELLITLKICHKVFKFSLASIWITAKLSRISRLRLSRLLGRHLRAHLSFQIIDALLQLVDLGSHFIYL